MSVPNFRKSYRMGFEKNFRKSRLSKVFDKTGNCGKSIQPKIGAIERRICLDPRNPMVPHFFKSVKRFKSYSVNKSPTLTRWWRYCGLVGDMKLGVSEEGTVLNECAKFQKKLPYGICISYQHLHPDRKRTRLNSSR